MSLINVKHLGLAAYIQMNGASLVKVDNGVFVFDSDRVVQDWRIAYNNSCCMRHDATVCELRKFLKT